MSDLIAEARKEIARLEIVVQEARSAPPLIKRLKALVATYEGATPSSHNGNGHGGKRRRGPRWSHKPAKCMLPASMHRPGTNKDFKSQGLCNNHLSKLRAGTMSEEENEAYDVALATAREKGWIEA